MDLKGLTIRRPRSNVVKSLEIKSAGTEGLSKFQSSFLKVIDIPWRESFLVQIQFETREIYSLEIFRSLSEILFTQTGSDIRSTSCFIACWWRHPCWNWVAVFWWAGQKSCSACRPPRLCSLCRLLGCESILNGNPIPTGMTSSASYKTACWSDVTASMSEQDLW